MSTTQPQIYSGPFYNTFNSAFFLSTGVLVCAFLSLIIKTCSKYRRINLCGIILERDRETAIEQDDFIPIPSL